MRIYSAEDWHSLFKALKAQKSSKPDICQVKHYDQFETPLKCCLRYPVSEASQHPICTSELRTTLQIIMVSYSGCWQPSLAQWRASPSCDRGAFKKNLEKGEEGLEWHHAEHCAVSWKSVASSQKPPHQFWKHSHQSWHLHLEGNSMFICKYTIIHRNSPTAPASKWLLHRWSSVIAESLSEWDLSLTFHLRYSDWQLSAPL